MKFDDHANDLCKEVCQKHNAFGYLAPFTNVDKRKNSNESFYKAFLINERAVRSTYNGQSSSFVNCFKRTTLSQYTIEILKF